MFFIGIMSVAVTASQRSTELRNLTVSKQNSLPVLGAPIRWGKLQLSCAGRQYCPCPPTFLQVGSVIKNFIKNQGPFCSYCRMQMLKSKDLCSDPDAVKLELGDLQNADKARFFPTGNSQDPILHT